VKYFISEQVVLMRPPEGPLAASICPFAGWISKQGYAQDSLRQRIRIAIGFSQWLGRRALRPPNIDSRHWTEYQRYRARHYQVQPGEAIALSQFREFLCHEGAIAAETVIPSRLTPVQRCTRDFERYLREERLLAPATIIYYVPFIAGFLKERFGTGPVRLSRLRARDVVRFVRCRAPRLHLKRAKLLTTALRSFLRYGCYRGEIRADLVTVVPCVANWSMPLIPRAITPHQVRKVLTHIDCSTAVGRRDYAILLMLARLGLRAGEIVFLELEDIDWQAGCLSIRGKGGHRSQLPLPQDVGDAIVAYLRHGRPRTDSRRVFLRAKAPVRGFLGPSAVSTVVRHALLHAGVEAPTAGAHQFRHGLASEMLRHGASLTEIGELLGHRSPETTKIYAKVDLEALRPLALPWPGGAR
jgi:integrase/recombinase XerD